MARIQSRKTTTKPAPATASVGESHVGAPTSALVAGPAAAPPARQIPQGAVPPTWEHGPIAELGVLLKPQEHTRFWFRWHPRRFQFVPDAPVPGFYPSLVTHRLLPGLNGLSKNGIVDRPSLHHVRSNWVDKGWTWIPEEAGPDGSYVRSYRSRYVPPAEQLRPDAMVYLSSFCDLVELGSGAVELAWRRMEYLDWLESLMVQGIIDRPGPRALHHIEERAQRELEGWMAQQDTALQQVNLEHAQQRLTAIREARAACD
jgi:hypothetical protein